MINQQRHYLHLRGKKTAKYHLWRLTEDEFAQLRSSSLPITLDSLFKAKLILSKQDNPERLSLPKALLTLEHFFGKSSNWFDEWKGSFSFPLLLMLDKSVGRFFYLLRIEDYRGSLDFQLHRFLENGADGYDISRYHEPFELEFSCEEINEFIDYLHCYLNFFASSSISNCTVKPFIKCIDGSGILYGYRDGEFFKERVESEEEYHTKSAFKSTTSKFAQAFNTRGFGRYE